VSHFLIKEQINQMKDSKELEILFLLLGYKFYPQYSPDGTGSIFFWKSELKNINLNIDSSITKKIKFLEQEYKKGAKILLGIEHHWVAITEIIVLYDKNEVYFKFNDPANGKNFKIPLKKFKDTYRIYIFRKDNNNIEELWTKINKWLEEEIELDLISFSRFKEKLQQEIKEKLKIKMETPQIHNNTIVVSKEIDINENTQLQPQLEDISEKDLIPIPTNIDVLENLKDFSQFKDQESYEPLCGEAFFNRILQIIRSNFSDYWKI